MAWLTWQSGGTGYEIAAAWLHDSVEDTTATLEDIRIQFPDFNIGTPSCAVDNAIQALLFFIHSEHFS